MRNSYWVSILKRMVGGHQPLEVKKLYKDKFILKGHWVVNQATHNEELFYDVGKALEERIITIKTQTIPKVEIDKFNSDLVRTTRLYSEEEVTRFVYYLYKKFPYFEDCLSTISKLKLEFAHETRKIADSSSPFDGFLEECLEPSEKTDKLVPLTKVLEVYNIYLGSEKIDIGTIDNEHQKEELDTDILCPHCNIPMIKMLDFDKHPIWYETCPQCQGIWFDAGEFKKFKDNFAQPKLLSKALNILRLKK